MPIDLLQLQTNPARVPESSPDRPSGTASGADELQF